MALAPDERGLLVLFRGKASGFRATQIGYMSLATSKLRAITNDTNDYATLTLSSDRKSLTTVQQKYDPALYLLTATDYAATSSKQVLAQQTDIYDFAWASNTELYISRWNSLSRSAIDGGSNIQLAGDPRAKISHIAGCGPGRLRGFRLGRTQREPQCPKPVACGCRWFESKTNHHWKVRQRTCVFSRWEVDLLRGTRVERDLPDSRRRWNERNSRGNNFSYLRKCCRRTRYFS